VSGKSVWRYALFAMAFAAMNEKDKAFDLLEKAFQERAISVLGIKVEPEYDRLRTDPRYQELIKRIGFPE
jgi:hypothetical protein